MESTISLFKGLEEVNDDFALGDDIIHNRPEWFDLGDYEETLYANYEGVITANNEYRYTDGAAQPLLLNRNIEYENGLMLRNTKFENEPFSFPVFTLEMETGTGKTYTYLKTMFELKQQYGFTKFIIVVPSIAIYEGTLQALKQTKEHFKSYYGNQIIIPVEYKINSIRNYATNQSLEAMIITIDSFNSKGNVIYKANDKLPGGLLPMEYLQKTRPILILDESQNYTSELCREALRTLKPLFALNYSATPKKENTFNLIYKLSPFEAFKDNLVKKIEVLGVTQQNNLNDSSLSMTLEKINRDLSADIQVFVYTNGVKAQQKIKVKKGDDLAYKTNNPGFDGFIIEEINLAKNQIIFTNQSILDGENTDGITLSEKEVRRVQIEETIKLHFEKQRKLRDSGIKVLTLFFIDHVANYKGEDPYLRTYFEDAFNKLKRDDEYFKSMNSSQVHNGYFARIKDQVVDEFDDLNSKDREEARKESFHLIMQDKERLLSMDEKVSFIFAHSAIREGWDNPNVFNICLLKKPIYGTQGQKDSRRQELGRGLRICVNQNGERVYDDGINVLTVICPEGFDEYVSALQNEYKESGDIDMPKPSNAYRGKAQRQDSVYNSRDFRDFWTKLMQKTSYNIKINTQELVKTCVKVFNDDKTQFPEPRIIITKGRYNKNHYSFSLIEARLQRARIRLSITDINGKKRESIQWLQERDTFFVKDNNDIKAKDFTVSKIDESKTNPSIIFSNGETLYKDKPYSFDGEPDMGQSVKTVQEGQTNYPVFNFVSRTAKATSLTRPTIISIFDAIDGKKKQKIMTNPEGFTTVFIETIKEQLANHVASKLEYTLSQNVPQIKVAAKQDLQKDLFTYETDNIEYGQFTAEATLSFGVSMDDYFPLEKSFPQRELIDGSEHSLYTKIQKDSQVEENFINKRIKPEDGQDGKIFCYFKFPANFKVYIPKILGKYYNPDWGIVRLDKDGKTKIQLVRETKGTEDTARLRFTNERRKIECAKKHFKALGVSYRPVSDKTLDWWLEE